MLDELAWMDEATREEAHQKVPFIDLARDSDPYLFYIDQSENAIRFNCESEKMIFLSLQFGVLAVKTAQ